MSIPTTNMQLIRTALMYYGVKEVAGKNQNEIISEMFEHIGYDQLNEETPWCSTYALHVARITGIDVKATLAARSWLKVGTPTLRPVMGDIVILWRGYKEGTKGHVGFFIRQDKNYIYILGGNQSDGVNITPYHHRLLLGYRRLDPILNEPHGEAQPESQPRTKKSLFKRAVPMFILKLIPFILKLLKR